MFRSCTKQVIQIAQDIAFMLKNVAIAGYNKTF